MRNSLLCILYLSLLLSPENSWAEKVYRIVVFGDSITSGYKLQAQDAFPAKLESRLRNAGYNVEVINLGNDNATSASATEETYPVIRKEPDVIIVQLGFNDAKLGVLPSATAYNLNTIVTALKKTGAYIILAGISPSGNLTDAVKQEMINNFYAVANRQKIPLVPNILERITGEPSMTLADGMHPNAVGGDAMVESVLPLVDTGLRWRMAVYQHALDEIKKTQPNLLPPVGEP